MISFVFSLHFYTYCCIFDVLTKKIYILCYLHLLVHVCISIWKLYIYLFSPFVAFVLLFLSENFIDKCACKAAAAGNSEEEDKEDNHPKWQEALLRKLSLVLVVIPVDLDILSSNNLGMPSQMRRGLRGRVTAENMNISNEDNDKFKENYYSNRDNEYYTWWVLCVLCQTFCNFTPALRYWMLGENLFEAPFNLHLRGCRHFHQSSSFPFCSRTGPWLTTHRHQTWEVSFQLQGAAYMQISLTSKITPTAQATNLPTKENDKNEKMKGDYMEMQGQLKRWWDKKDKQAKTSADLFCVCCLMDIFNLFVW